MITLNTLKYFTCYPRANKAQVDELRDLLIRHFRISSSFDYQGWQDCQIIAGENWDEEIQTALKSCDFGLLMLSLDFFASKYITEKELDHFLNGQAYPVPICLESSVLSGNYRTLGLEKLQIYRLESGNAAPRAYFDCRDIRQKEAFAEGLFQQIEIAMKKR